MSLFCLAVIKIKEQKRLTKDDIKWEIMSNEIHGIKLEKYQMRRKSGLYY